MKSLTTQISLSMLLLAPFATFAGTYNQGLINVPNAISVFEIGGIDDANQIVGGFEDINGNYHGWLLSQGTFAQLDLTGQDYVFPFGINSTKGIVGYGYAGGAVAGYLNANRNSKIVAGGSGKRLSGINASGSYIGEDGNGRGFVNSGGTYSYFVPAPCSSLGGHIDVVPNGINAHGDMVGSCSGNNGQIGWARIGGVDQAVAAFGQTLTFPTGINDSGVIAGYFLQTDGHYHGFLLTAGVATQWDYQDGAYPYTATEITGINNSGSLCGQAFDSSRNAWSIFYAFAQ